MNKWARETSCNICGYPNAQEGDMCPECTEKTERENKAMAEALTDFFHPRWVHSSMHGYIDPWTRKGRALLDD
jgi:hypothetical protein